MMMNVSRHVFKFFFLFSHVLKRYYFLNIFSLQRFYIYGERSELMKAEEREGEEER